MKVRVLLLSLVLVLTSISPHAHSEESEAKIAIAYEIGFLGDNSYNDAIHRALELAKKRYGLVEPFVREVPTSGTTLDRLTRLRFLAKSGYTLIIAIGSGYRETLKRASREYPSVQFAIINDQSVSPLNISNIYFDENQSAYLAGYIAALRSTRKAIAIVDGDPGVIEAFQSGARTARKSVQARAVTFNGSVAQLEKELGSADVVYSLWDKDASIYKLVSARVPKSWYIARVPDQYFITAGIKSARVAAVIAKDYRRPIFDLVEAALADRAVIDILDESGIYGREYSFANSAIKVELDSAFNSSARSKIQREIERLGITNQG
jgi:basic membrane protein A